MSSVAYTIGTLVTRPDEYAEMKASFAAHGFTDADCEFIEIDNSSGNSYTAYDGLNHVLNEARGERIILCHQDIRLVDDDRSVLDQRLSELNERDPLWAVAGNAGGVESNYFVLHITDIGGKNRRNGDLPERVVSVDENFMVLRRDARIAFSNNLRGFHLYGADICIIADILGYNAYAIDFHLEHLGKGVMGLPFEQERTRFRQKWNHALRDRFIQTTVTFLLITGKDSPLWWLKVRERIDRTVRRIRRSIRKRMPKT